MSALDPIDETEAAALLRVAERFAVAVTPAMRALIDPTDPADPIARQFAPDVAELIEDPEELSDPIGDASHSPLPGIVHRYPDRVLLKPIKACPVYCRFCFRRETVGPGNKGLSAEQLEAAIAYIATRPEIFEVILTGGDPLALSARRLSDILARLFAIPHLGIIRIHTRVPVVQPERITAAMAKALRGDKPVYVVLHANHAREFTPQARAALARLADAGLPLLGQSVLLRGVNDSETALADLFRAMLTARVKPYHLNHLDKARGTGHFRVPLQEGQALVAKLRGRVSGLAQPTYILDIPGGHGKVPVGPVYAQPTEDGGWQVTDPWNCRHDYREG
ncbi:lysine-2,3-aminomutase-like protein [Ferrovibrio sp.]|uniref:lysine-2,3-aminomutase-like protein n=1 Tax=Ferrovibrio sp. TaxID=1917215 RepID=UPI0025BF1821|nr:lysine-2,3-aminomutase-like protein [Ferrovibrio sp.]MBX3454972.1 lysine-2,3-aminomutase-like protein [Ferrovibrio sp.]